eukprot:TRINITY_DN17648_c1_g1_i2.p3 TRINITY_DN17648_c1_g1~~TRINITY_DN17648_c1_g1_i2.p3  ORF type:complete len:156 (+),score=50.84 TRINITY_DN17648_c1_g1_i2:68-535(+)
MDLNDISDDFGLADEAVEEGVVQQSPKVIEEEEEQQGEQDPEINNQNKKQRIESLEELEGDECIEVEKSEILCSAPSSPQKFFRVLLGVGLGAVGLYVGGMTPEGIRSFTRVVGCLMGAMVGGFVGNMAQETRQSAAAVELHNLFVDAVSWWHAS